MKPPEMYVVGEDVVCPKRGSTAWFVRGPRVNEQHRSRDAAMLRASELNEVYAEVFEIEAALEEAAA
jgi:hypothetical protein